MKDELGEKMMTKFIGLKPKTNSYLEDYGSEDKKGKGTKKCEDKKAKGTKKCVIKINSN